MKLAIRISFCLFFLFQLNALSNNWEQLESPFTGAFVQMIIDDSNGHLYGLDWENNIFMSSNNGDDWLKFPEFFMEPYTCPESFYFVDLIYAHNDTLLVEGSYRETFSNISETHHFRTGNKGLSWDTLNPKRFLCADGKGNVYFSDSSAIVRTSDNCLSFSIFLNSNQAGKHLINHLEIGNSGEIVVSALDSGYNAGLLLFKSLDTGKTWNKINLDLKGQNIQELFKSNNNVLYVSSRDYLSFSTDFGDTWTVFSDSLPSPVYKFTAWDNHLILQAGSNKNYISSNNGKSWDRLLINNDTLEVYGFAKNRNSPLYAYTVYDGITRSSDNGKSWTDITRGLNQMFIPYFICGGPEDVVISDGIRNFFSSDNGNNWKKFRFDFTVHKLQMVSRNGLIYAKDGLPYCDYPDGRHIFMSSDTGRSWITEGPNNVLEITDNKNGDIFAITCYNLYKKPYGHDEWIKLVMPTFYANAWASIFANNYEVFFLINSGFYRYNLNLYSVEQYVNYSSPPDVGSNYYLKMDSRSNLYAVNPSRIFKSENMGQSWTVIKEFENTSVRDFLIADNDEILVATGNGLLTSTDGGSTFSYDTGIPEGREVSSLGATGNGYVFAGVQDDHIYRRKMITSVESTESPSEEGLNVIPNPASDYINVTNTEDRNLRSVEIYNTTGRLLIAQDQGIENIGRINISSLENGIYYVKVKYQDKVAFSRFIVLK